MAIAAPLWIAWVLICVYMLYALVRGERFWLGRVSRREKRPRRRPRAAARRCGGRGHARRLGARAGRNRTRARGL